MATDAFTYSNGALPTASGGVWVAQTGGDADLNVSSNAVGAFGTTSQYCVNRYGTTFGTDHYSQVTITNTSTTNDNEFGVLTRMATGALSGYYGWLDDTGVAHLQEVTNGSFADLDTSAGGLAINGVTLRLESIGSEHKLYHNDVEVCSATDATFNANTSVGIASFLQQNSAFSADNWEGGDIGGGDSADITLGAFTSSASGTVDNPPAVGYVKEVGFVTNTTAGTTSSITVAAGGVPVDDVVVIYGACDNTGSSGAATTITVTDTRGNTWTTQSAQAIADPGAASAGQQGFFVVSKITTALQAGDTITITYGNSTAAKAVNAQQFTGVHLGSPVLSGSYSTQNNQTGTSNSVSATPSAAGQAVCALVAVEGGTADSFTQDSDTTDGAWVTLTRRGSGTTTSGSTLNSVYKLVSGTTAQTYNPTLGTARDHCAAILVLDVAVPVAGTAAVTLGSFTSSASGTVTTPDVSGSAAITLAAFTSSASGTVTAPPVSGSAAITLAAFTTSAAGSLFAGRYPASISGKKVRDQFGDVYLTKTFSSWKLANKLSDADITTALEGVAGNGFNGVTVWCGGIEDRAGEGDQYLNEANDNFWSGTPWASSLGPAWSSVDHIVSECARLELVLHFSFCAGFSTEGCGPDWESATNTNMYDAGVAIATRYASSPNIVWHIMFDDSTTTGSTRGQRIQALFDGINDTEGPSTRPVRWCENNQGDTTSEAGWYAAGNFAASINCMYEYTATSGDSVVAIEAEYAEEAGPFGDCEPPYSGAGHYPGNEDQQMRERNYAIFIEGGQLINFGHEDWWPFGGAGLFSDGETWDTVQADVEPIEAGYAWSLIDTYCADTTWAPTSGFVTTGQGSGDTKAAQGASDTAALAYFPDNRTVQVDTTILAGTGNVRLRWYDPTAGTFSTIAASEAQQTGRSVTLPAAHGDGTRDFVLVVDAVDDVTGTAAVALGAFTSAASGTSSPPAITGTAAISLGSFTAAATGSTTSGTAAITLGSFTSAAAATVTPPSFTGSAAVTLASFTVAASGASAPPPVTGTAAVTLAAFTASATGAFIPEGSGAGSVTLAPFTATAAGTVTLPPVTGTAAVVLGPLVADASGATVPPNFTGVAAVSLVPFTVAASGTFELAGTSGTAAVVLAPFAAAASGETIAPPFVVGTATSALHSAGATSTITAAGASSTISDARASSTITPED